MPRLWTREIAFVPQGWRFVRQRKPHPPVYLCLTVRQTNTPWDTLAFRDKKARFAESRNDKCAGYVGDRQDWKRITTRPAFAVDSRHPYFDAGFRGVVEIDDARNFRPDHNRLSPLMHVIFHRIH